MRRQCARFARRGGVEHLHIHQPETVAATTGVAEREEGTTKPSLVVRGRALQHQREAQPSLTNPGDREPRQAIAFSSVQKG